MFNSGASQANDVLRLRWRLFDFGRINAQIQQAEGQEAEMLAACRLAALHATEDIENAFSALVKREHQAAVLAQGVDSLGHERTASFAACQKGVVSLIEVLQADENLLRAFDDRAQAQTETVRAAVAAFEALVVDGSPANRTRSQSSDGGTPGTSPKKLTAPKASEVVDRLRRERLGDIQAVSCHWYATDIVCMRTVALTRFTVHR
ncbi:hypothetical protein LMG27174_06268 [Paraburkholderia rhynchosiae]|uniref:Uncharacterized protein n=1 Tax=Paraburkholderia rhynchosiae TaxID=487049 RepID=A0A6J5CIB8_9BURK|nr:hypothetical protein LMG27174_06268 [Paraburkholderia rhynchosiae]